jgi:hypothetical protein
MACRGTALLFTFYISLIICANFYTDIGEKYNIRFHNILHLLVERMIVNPLPDEKKNKIALHNIVSKYYTHGV